MNIPSIITYFKNSYHTQAAKFLRLGFLLVLLIIPSAGFASGHMLNGLEYVIELFAGLWALGFVALILAYIHSRHPSIVLKVFVWLLSIPSIIIGIAGAALSSTSGSDFIHLILVLPGITGGLSLYLLYRKKQRNTDVETRW